MPRKLAILIAAVCVSVVVWYFFITTTTNTSYGAELSLERVGECGEFGLARFEYIKTQKDFIEFSAVFYPYCNAEPGKNLFAKCDKRDGTILVRVVFDDNKATKCVCPFRVKGKITGLEEGEYNISILFDNRYSRQEKVLCWQTVHLSELERFYPEKLSINVTPKAGEYLKAEFSTFSGRTKILLQNVKLSLCVLNQTCPPSEEKIEKIGIEISGSVRNEYERAYYVCLYAVAYNSRGEVVGRSVDYGPICGLTVLHLQSGETKDFKLHVELKNDIRQIEIFVGCLSEIPPP